jgi:hypothetical protein
MKTLQALQNSIDSIFFASRKGDGLLGRYLRRLQSYVKRRLKDSFLMPDDPLGKQIFQTNYAVGSKMIT